MNLHKRHGNSSQGVTNGNTGMGVGSRIDNDTVKPVRTGLDDIDNLAFVIGLFKETLQPNSSARSSRALLISAMVSVP